MGINILHRIIVVDVDDRRDGGEVAPGGKVGAVSGLVVLVVCAVPGGAVIVPSSGGKVVPSGDDVAGGIVVALYRGHIGAIVNVGAFVDPPPVSSPRSVNISPLLTVLSPSISCPPRSPIQVPSCLSGWSH